MFSRAADDGAKAIQIFSKSSSQWAAKPLALPARRAFLSARRAAGSPPMAIHDSYLINLASPDEDLYRKSLDAFVDELRRAGQLGIEYLVMHPGSPGERGDDFGITRVAAALNRALYRTRSQQVIVLLENTAGQGAHVGWRFEHLRGIIDGIRNRERVGVCFDTQHAFAAGYDLRSKRGYEQTFTDFERIVGIANIRAFHLNDSKRPLGSRVDRHEHIGEGALGTAPFRRLVNDPRFANVPGFLETPGHFRENLDRLKSFRRRGR